MAWRRKGGHPLSPVGRHLLERSFPRKARRRILLAYQDDRLAHPQFAPFLHYGARFAKRGIHFRAVRYRDLDPQVLPGQLDAIFLQSSYAPASGELEGLLSLLKQARPELRISYFDWFAPADIRFAERVEEWVCAYVKKSLLRDRSEYLRPTIGHTNLGDYFSARFHTENPPCEWSVPSSILRRLVVGPSFSTSPDLASLFEKDEPPLQGVRPIDLHARIATEGTPWYAAMRGEAAAAVSASFPDLNVASQGLISKSRYMRELAQSKLCFSPFGYGEVCWRDFEAVAAGAVVVKPDMSHLETDPDIYHPFETYIPVRWDLADLEEKVRDALADPESLRRMAVRAFNIVRDHLRGPSLADLAARLAGDAD
jgi:hypothetical protein